MCKQITAVNRKLVAEEENELQYYAQSLTQLYKEHGRNRTDFIVIITKFIIIIIIIIFIIIIIIIIIIFQKKLYIEVMLILLLTNRH